MRAMLQKTRNYCIVILKQGPNRNMAGVEKIIWEHGRRNFALRAEGILPIVCPVSDETELDGLGILNASLDEAKKIMDEIPGDKGGNLCL